MLVSKNTGKCEMKPLPRAFFVSTERLPDTMGDKMKKSYAEYSRVLGKSPIGSIRMNHSIHGTKPLREPILTYIYYIGVSPD